MKVQVITDPVFIANIKGKSTRAPERDVPGGITCWREGNVEHFFLHDAYLHSIPYLPLPTSHQQ